MRDSLGARPGGGIFVAIVDPRAEEIAADHLFISGRWRVGLFRFATVKMVIALGNARRGARYQVDEGAPG